jgi:hypothetical protein
VNPAVTYVAMDGNGAGGLEQTSKMVHRSGLGLVVTPEAAWHDGLN